MSASKEGIADRADLSGTLKSEYTHERPRSHMTQGTVKGSSQPTAWVMPMNPLGAWLAIQEGREQE